MDFIIPLIKAYLNLRIITLISLQSCHTTAKSLTKTIGLSESKYYNRKKTPDNWTIDEILGLAEHMNFSTGTAALVKKLAMIIDLLPASEKALVLRKGNLNSSKLKTRMVDYNHWRLIDFQKIVENCNRNNNVSKRFERQSHLVN